MKLAVITFTSFAALLIVGQASAGADGKAVYDKSCAGCHTAMSPKLTGEKAKWEPLLKQGKDALTASVIKGKGMMPPKGGAASDADVKAAVEYMIANIK
ncbi:MAG: c-type cytochrome [Gammaproteobacteria bacterium]|nr:c-type cytochrome [Gammaproteobacteria bacterium]MDH5512541.1 c-type cytochrome [Gammaproteobacteria bacterium]